MSTIAESLARASGIVHYLHPVVSRQSLTDPCSKTPLSKGDGGFYDLICSECCSMPTLPLWLLSYVFLLVCVCACQPLFKRGTPIYFITKAGGSSPLMSLLPTKLFMSWEDIMADHHDVPSKKNFLTPLFDHCVQCSVFGTLAGNCCQSVAKEHLTHSLKWLTGLDGVLPRNVSKARRPRPLMTLGCTIHYHSCRNKLRRARRSPRMHLS